VTRRLLIGVGNVDRGDDGVGRTVARRLRARKACALLIRECVGDAAALMEAWTGFDDVVLVDACRGAGRAGSVHCLDATQMDLARTLQGASTHSFGVATALALARALGTLPSRLVIYAIEAGACEAGAGLSPEVDRAADEVVASVMQGIQT
jgi:hydrogenase maturation protease